jgi:hypothetical protein
MSLILAPNGLPGTRVQETLTKEEIDLVLKFEAWTRKRGIALDLICKKCLDDGYEQKSRCKGDNTPNSIRYQISCGHADRVYGA